MNAKLLVKTLHNATLIPTACIQRNGDAAYVYVIQSNSTVKSQDIKIQTTDMDTAAVTGVNPGDVLVSDGFDKLQDGTKLVLRKPVVPTQQAVLPQAPAGQGSSGQGMIKRPNAGSRTNRNPRGNNRPEHTQ